MNFPSLKTLEAAFPTKGKELREILTGDYSKIAKLEQCDVVLGTYGVERIARGHNAKSPCIDYCNTGETYQTTIMLLAGAHFRVGCWGDVVEAGRYD